MNFRVSEGRGEELGARAEFDFEVAAPVAVRALQGWGKYPVVWGREVWGEKLEDITRAANLSRGLGRSYGDASLPAAAADLVANTSLADRLLAFNPQTGVVRAEAGLCLRRLNEWSLRRGWFTPVTPGTQHVTLGGMVAADVHGKNHHRSGCFGAYVRSLRLRVADGRVVECSESAEPELFRATLGGMGLTGHILEVEFQLERIPSSWIWEETERAEDIEALIERLRRAGAHWPFTVSWVDCAGSGGKLGRGVLIKGRWADPAEAPRKLPPPRRSVALPFDLPSRLLAAWMARAFNALYHRVHRERARAVHPTAFFYPLDFVREWNRAYGKRGFTQYQCVLPHGEDRYSPRRFLERVQARGAPVYLCVMKDCGPEGRGMLSFPKPGISLALDLPIRDPQSMQRLVDELNEFVIAAGGRVYLAKDAFTRAEHYAAMEPRLSQWRRVRDRWDPAHRLRSAQSARLLGDRA